MKIMQLNLNHCAAAQDLLLESIRENEVDVCVLSEPFRPGFGADWTCDHTGKAAIWVCGRNPHQFGHQQADGGFVRALVGSVWVYSVYLAPSLSISDFANTLDRLAADVRDHSPAFVAGDFNAWAVDWGSMVTNQRGRLVVEAFASLDLTLLNQGSKWTFSRAGTGSIVDLTFCSSSLAHLADSEPQVHLCRTSLEEFLSQQAKRRALYKLAERAGGLRQRRADGRDCHGKARVGLRRLHAESSKPLATPYTSLLVERNHCRCKTCLQPREEALSESAGKTLFLYWQTLFRESRKTLKNAIKESKKRCFLALCDTLDDVPWGKAYQIVIKRIGARRSPPPPDDLLRGIVMDLFPSVEEDNAWLPDTASNDGLPLKLVTSEEVLKCVRAYLPHRRGGETAGEGDLHSLEEAILVNGNLSPNQYGFRKARSTVDAIEKVVGIASNAIAGTRWKGGQKKYCLMVTLDIRNAFNSARWNCILRALDAFKVPRQLLKIIRSYFSSRVLKYDTSVRTEEYIVTGGVPQGSVLGPLLWNAMYDGILRLDLPTGANLIGFADDIALLVVAKELEVAESNCNRAIDCIGTWLLSVGLELAPQKTEAVLISSRKKVETAVVKVGAAHITSKRTLKYLGVTIDSRLSFREHLQEVGRKAAVTNRALSRLMPNTRGPKQCRRALISSVTRSIALYAAPIWADAVIKSSYIGGLASTFRLSAIRVISGFRTVSDEAAHVIAGIPPSRKWSGEGRWTHRLIPLIKEWTTRSHGQLNFHLTQVISGHGCFRSYLFRFGHDTAEECPACFPTAVEDAEHVIFQCGRYATLRQELAVAIGERLTVSTLVPLMLVSSTNWTLISQFVAAVMNEQRRAEKARQRTRE
ncbi:uncharacterized protein LOC132797741 [Drosophila nasuta]|uniref:uncharacterized protein LOC132797741 n=1 Tax=Drosophila nasuta TaxID=42062 RepID=UPI00295F2E25|nr:uncharacterized protein LOC132797741 [Drosophila nasuta]